MQMPADPLGDWGFECYLPCAWEIYCGEVVKRPTFREENFFLFGVIVGMVITMLLTVAYMVELKCY